MKETLKKTGGSRTESPVPGQVRGEGWLGKGWGRVGKGWGKGG
jgi:hypothetical protein